MEPFWAAPQPKGVPDMTHLTKRDRLAILELASEIASEAAQNPNVVWIIEFQEQLVESLYRKMTDLIESDLEIAAKKEEQEGEEEEEDDEVEEDAAADEGEAAEPESDREHDEINKKGKQKKGKKAA
jgi:hypothetical protein